MKSRYDNNSNNLNRNNQISQSGKNVKNVRMQNGIPEKESEVSNIYLLIKFFLLISALIVVFLFWSLIQFDYHFDYVDTPRPTASYVSKSDEPQEKIYEREIPVKEEVEPSDVLLEYDFSSPVPECDAYPLDYFNDTIFIGDSRTAGLIMYTRLSPIDCSATGFNLKNFDSKKCITYTNDEGDKSLITCAEALELYKGQYKSVYISTGVNELGWNSKVFIQRYKAVIDSIREITDVPIYIQLILPVTAAYEAKSENGITNEKQAAFNDELRTLATDEKLFLLDPLEIFTLEDGTLDTDKTYDGAHLEKFACGELLEYYQTHVVDTLLYSNLSNENISE